MELCSALEHEREQERSSPSNYDRYHAEHHSIKCFAVTYSEDSTIEEHEAQLDGAQSQDKH